MSKFRTIKVKEEVYNKLCKMRVRMEHEILETEGIPVRITFSDLIEKLLKETSEKEEGETR